MRYASLARARPDSGRSPQDGSAFIIALMVLFLLTIMGLSVSLLTQTEILAASQERTIERTFYAAEAGLEMSIARALGSGDYGPVTHVVERSDFEQGALARVRDRVESSPFVCMGDMPCNLCSINQGAQYVKRGYEVSVNAVREGVTSTGEVPIGRKSLSEMIDVEPSQTILDCLAYQTAE